MKRAQIYTLKRLPIIGPQKQIYTISSLRLNKQHGGTSISYIVLIIYYVENNKTYIIVTNSPVLEFPSMKTKFNSKNDVFALLNSLGMQIAASNTTKATPHEIRNTSAGEIDNYLYVYCLKLVNPREKYFQNHNIYELKEMNEDTFKTVRIATNTKAIIQQSQSLLNALKTTVYPTVEYIQFRIVQAKGDGACLFYAIGLQLPGYENAEVTSLTPDKLTRIKDKMIAEYYKLTLDDLKIIIHDMGKKIDGVETFNGQHISTYTDAIDDVITTKGPVLLSDIFDRDAEYVTTKNTQVDGLSFLFNTINTIRDAMMQACFYGGHTEAMLLSRAYNVNVIIYMIQTNTVFATYENLTHSPEKTIYIVHMATVENPFNNHFNRLLPQKPLST